MTTVIYLICTNTPERNGLCLSVDKVCYNFCVCISMRSCRVLPLSGMHYFMRYYIVCNTYQALQQSMLHLSRVGGKHGLRKTKSVHCWFAHVHCILFIGPRGRMKDEKERDAPSL